MTRHWHGGPERDPELRDALRRLEPGPSPAADDVLRARISLVAQPALRELRSAARMPARTWLDWTSGWATLTVPAGAAVALASVLLVAQAGVPVSTAAALTDTVTVSSLLMSDEETSGGEVLDRLLAPAEREWLFTQAMGQ